MDDIEIAQRIRKLFSDGGIRNNGFLCKHILRNPEGHVPWSVVHSCRSFRDKDLASLVSIISQHLSDQLVVHHDRQSITRMQQPLLTFDDMDSHWAQTLVLDNLPTETSQPDTGAIQNQWVERIQNRFRDFNSIYIQIQHRLVSTFVPDHDDDDKIGNHEHSGNSPPKRSFRKLKPSKRGWATVEFDSPSSVQAAIRQLEKEPLILEGMKLRASSMEAQLQQAEEDYWKAYCCFRSSQTPKRFGHMEIPQWKNIPLRPNQVFVYNLKIRRYSKGGDAVDNQDNTSRNEACLGLLLPIHLGEMAWRSTTHSDPAAVVFQTRFTSQTKDRQTSKLDNHNFFQVELSYVRRDEGFSLSQLRRLRQFNQALWGWKRYGGYSNNHSLDQAHKQQAPPTYVATESTALFVPWKSGEDDNLKEIDWTMIHFETNRITIPFFDRLYSTNSQDHLFQTHVATYFKQCFVVEGACEGMDATSIAGVDQKTRIQYNLREDCTQREYITKRYRTEVPNPSLPLLKSTIFDASKYCGGEWFDQESLESEETRHFLCPDYVEFLPISLSVLKVMSLASSFMPALERKIGLCLLIHQWICQLDTSPSPVFRDLAEQQARSKELALVELFRTATTIHPTPTYDRLEFLGDAVLKYFLGLNAIAKNDGFEQDCEEMNETVAYAGKNKTLATAARKLGIQNILYMHHDTAFHSCYENQASKKVTTKEISGKQWSDCVEALLGAVYLADKTGALCIYLLEMIQLPSSKEDSDCEREGMPWFAASGCCLEGCYPIGKDSNFQAQIDKAFSVLSAHPEVRTHLESGRQRVLKLLNLDASSGYVASLGARFYSLLGTAFPSYHVACIRKDKLDRETFALLLQVALFDDGLDFPDDPRGYQRNPEDFLSLALLREAMYVQGGWSLELFLSQELYRRYPKATSNDFHMQRACFINDDVLSYIFIKSGLRDCFYDSESENALAFGELIAAAENTSKQLCENNTCDSPAHFVLQEYPGLAGGRLVGFRAKIAKKITEELMVSFKTLFGALVLGLGATRAWASFRPFFDELLALSPNDLRKYYAHDPSSVVAAYKTKARRK